MDKTIKLKIGDTEIDCTPAKDKDLTKTSLYVTLYMKRKNRYYFKSSDSRIMVESDNEALLQLKYNQTYRMTFTY